MTTTAAQTTTSESTTTSASTTTTVEPTTTVLVVEECEGGGAPFETVPGVTCDEVYQQTKILLLRFEGFEGLEGFGLELQAGSVCHTIAGPDTKTYEPESTHFPALAQALSNTYCPGDMGLLVLNS